MNDPVISALKAEQSRVVLDFFRRKPKMTDVSYEYGYAQGVYAGLEMAINSVIKLYKDEKEAEFD